jgi:Tol biopolymer transport system component
VNCIQISGQLYQGAWSPVADRYIFLQSRQIGADAQNNGEVATTDVVLLDAATLQTKVIATDVRGLNCLTWSPDGRYVLFHSCGP